MADLTLLFVVDARSPIVTDWIRYFAIQDGVQVHVVSTYPASPPSDDIDSYTEFPVAFARLVGGGSQSNESSEPPKSLASTRVRLRGSRLSGVFSSTRRQIGPLTLWFHKARFRKLVREVTPDVVHAMRIPMEGLFASSALDDLDVPLVLSVWGNDFTLHARKSPAVRRKTRHALARADGLMADCFRDIRLAQASGFSFERPALRVPGNGGIDPHVFFPAVDDPGTRRRLGIPPDVKVVANLRGVREYVRTDSFLGAVRHVIDERDDVWFVATGMRGNSRYEGLAQDLGINDKFRMLGNVPRTMVADLYRLADVAVSPSLHDGTPNSLLEAMACGAFPVVGDIETMHEWLEEDKTAIFVDPNSSRSISSGILRALESDTLRRAAAELNVSRVHSTAAFASGMRRVQDFYMSMSSR